MSPPLDFFNFLQHSILDPWRLSIAIFVIAVIAFLFFYVELSKVTSELIKARGAVQVFKESGGNFDALSDFMSRSTYLSKPWGKLKKSLIIDVDELDGSKRIATTQEVSDHINDQTVLNPRINLRLFQAWPNILVGIGLLCTFLGIVLALWYASKGVAAKEVEEAQAALRNLLDAATFKFLTSLAGLLSSILFSVGEKRILHKIGGTIEQLAKELEDSFEHRSLEKIAHQRYLIMLSEHALLQEQLEEARQQTAQIKRFETDFAVSIASALDSRLGSRFEYLAATLSVAIENLSMKIGSVNEEALQTMVDDFRKTLAEGTGSEIAKMASLVEQLGTRLETSGQTLETRLTGAGNAVSDTFKVIAADIQTTGNGFNEIIRNAGAEVAGSFDRLSVDIDKRGKDIQNMLKSAEQSMSGVFNLIAEKLDHSGKKLADNLQKAGEEITGSAKMLDTVLVNLKADLIDLEGTVKQASESAEKTTSLLAKNVTDLSMLHESIGATLNGLQEVGVTIENAAESLESAFTSMATAQKATTGESRQFLETAQATLSAIEVSNKSITVVTGALQSAWESYQARFERVDEDLERVFGQIQMGLEQYAEKVREFQSSLDVHLSTAMQSLGALVQELSDSVEELHEAK